MSHMRAHVLWVLVLASICICTPPALAAASAHYDMSVAVDYDAGSFTGQLRVEYPNATGVALSELFFRLFPNAMGIYGNASLRVIEARVEEQPIAAKTFVEDTVLLVPLSSPLAPDARIALTIEFEGSAEDWRDGPPSPYTYGLLTRSDNAMTLTAFYPILALYTEEGWSLDPVFEYGDALMSEASSYEMDLTIPAEITPVASGTLDGQVEESEFVTYHYTIEGARDFSVVLVDGYEQRAATTGDTALRAWFTPEKGEAAEIALDRASNAHALFSSLIGKLPYEEIDIVEVPMQHAAGVEFSGLILVSSVYTPNPRDVFYDVIISHEMAHQWFYGAVGNDIAEDPWLDESLATYLSYLYLDAFREPGVASGMFDQWQRAYERARADAPSVTITSPIYTFSQSSSYSSFVYSGGAVFLHAVRETIGDDLFFDALAFYYAENLGLIASPSDLIGAFEASCECRLTDLLRSFGFLP